MHVLSSALVLPVMVALHPERTLSLSRLARAVEAPVSSVQVTLRNLMADGLVVGQGQRKHRTYRLAASAATTHLLRLATTLLPIGRQLRIIGRVDDTIEFLARRDAEVIVVFAAGSDAMAE